MYQTSLAKNNKLILRSFDYEKNGFTLVEIVLVIILIGILSISFSIKFSGLEEIKLSSAVSKLAADISYVQQLAITTQVYHGINFDTLNEKYSLFSIEADGTITNVKDPYSGETEINYTAGGLRGVTISSVTINGSNQLLFDWQGLPAITHDATITLECKGRTKTLTVVAGTGKVKY